jgi:hypothetical protein
MVDECVVAIRAGEEIGYSASVVVGVMRPRHGLLCGVMVSTCSMG